MYAKLTLNLRKIYDKWQYERDLIASATFIGCSSRTIPASCIFIQVHLETYIGLKPEENKTKIEFWFWFIFGAYNIFAHVFFAIVNFFCPSILKQVIFDTFVLLFVFFVAAICSLQLRYLQKQCFLGVSKRYGCKNLPSKNKYSTNIITYNLGLYIKHLFV